jgi:hypothetical protein
MVKQRFLTHFKPWLFAVSRVAGPIVGYQLLNQARAFFQYAPLGVADVLAGASVALLVIGLLCGLWAWGEWWWFQLRGLRGLCRELKLAFNNHWRPPAVRTARSVNGTMV